MQTLAVLFAVCLLGLYVLIESGTDTINNCEDCEDAINDCDDCEDTINDCEEI